jgi:hypothetical protein
LNAGCWFTSFDRPYHHDYYTNAELSAAKKSTGYTEDNLATLTREVH